MDWNIICLIAAVCAAAAAIWKMQRFKKEVYEFERQVEQALDRILLGQEMMAASSTGTSDLQDTLWGKCSEKIARVGQICQNKERKSRREKEQIKELISDISHQTKTPLANIKLYLEFLEQEALSDQGIEFLKNLNKQTEKLDFLFQSMVKMSRLEAGVIQIRSEEHELYKTIAKAVEQIVPAASDKKIGLSVDCDKNIKLWHDKKWLEEAVFNVLDNAVKYTNVGGSIFVKVCRQEIFTKISICDNGKGILQERQAAIFTRFYREPEVHDQTGIGVGLYLTRQILELQGGYIEVRSAYGKGAEFCLYLPNDLKKITVL